MAAPQRTHDHMPFGSRPPSRLEMIRWQPKKGIKRPTEDWCGGLCCGWLPFQRLVSCSTADLQGEPSDRRRQEMVSST
ncbi:hypothetical protein PAXRUDRAFT_829197 [Paxillus rubicundulus Ve08.2h10]|uniref:Uncharacterized protein n=1 Tax=Paxillus rubicundulus Ve08.2h10 TaxID=930991 RepID=A0A0D0D8A4_9AGAM|nr:hypothetical protein PAXRUDRAFT_829197 [Paxillus rubicundulus Ve08.2h10]